MSSPSSAIGAFISHAKSWILAYALPLLLISYTLQNYSRSFENRSSLNQYFRGVYASRVLGRESVVGLAIVAQFLLSHLGIAHISGVMIGWLLTNGTSFMMAALLMHRQVARLGAKPTLLYGVLLVAMAISARVVTPYDLMSYTFILVVFQYAIRGARWRCAVLMVLAVATRESTLLVIPMIAISQVAWPSRDSSGRFAMLRETIRIFRSSVTLWLLALVGMATYGTLKLISFSSGEHPRFVQHVGASGHLGANNICGVLSALLMVAAVRWAAGFVSSSAYVSEMRNLLWLLATPYLVICFIWGIWSEAPRLVMPLLIGEFLLTVACFPNHNCDSSNVTKMWDTVRAKSSAPLEGFESVTSLAEWID